MDSGFISSQSVHEKNQPLPADPHAARLSFHSIPPDQAQQQYHYQQQIQMQLQLQKQDSSKLLSNSDLDIAQTLKNSNLSASQKVSFITEINSKNQPSKNLSHVPCKFFRQGACQAGNSCPFSHATDISLDSQPCKYFQKGNCKFGIKCALAHILPDGRKVNQKSFSQNYQYNNQYASQLSSQSPSQSQSQPQPQSSMNYSNLDTPYYDFSQMPNIKNPMSFSDTSIEPINIQDMYSQNINQQNNQNQQQFGFQYSQITNINNINIDASSYLDNVMSPSNSNFQSIFSISSTAPTTATPTSPFNNSISIWSSPSGKITSNQTQRSIRSVSLSQQPVRPLAVPLSNDSETENTTKTSISTTFSNLSPSKNEIAIIDSEDEETKDNEDVDFLPSSLQELLTPQELKRRQSRPSFGTPKMSNIFGKTLIINDDDTQFFMD